MEQTTTINELGPEKFGTSEWMVSSGNLISTNIIADNILRQNTEPKIKAGVPAFEKFNTSEWMLAVTNVLTDNTAKIKQLKVQVDTLYWASGVTAITVILLFLKVFHVF